MAAISLHLTPPIDPRGKESPLQSHTDMLTKDGLTSLSIFITPQCYKITTIPPSERGDRECALHQTDEGISHPPSQAPAFSSRVDQATTYLPLPSLPPHVCALRRRSRHRQLTARGVLAGTPSRVICVCLPFAHHLVPPLSFSFPYLSSLFSQAKPNMLPNPRKRNPLPCPKVSPLVGIPVPFFQSRPVDQPHMYVFGYVCTDTKQHLSMATGARVEVPSTSSSIASIRVAA